MKGFLPVIFAISCFSILVPHIVLAQTPTPLPSSHPFSGFLQWITERINPPLEKVNQGSLPPLVYQEDISTEGSTDPFTKSAYLHKTAVSVRTPEQTSTSFSDSLKDFVSDIFGFGNKKAEEFISTELPRGTIEGNMIKALPALQCAHLPVGVGGCSQTGSLIGEPEKDISGVPQISPSVPVITPPPSSGCGRGNGGGYYDYSVGRCVIQQKGYCSVACLAPFFGGDEIKAKKAAQICFRESGGDPFATNRGCLPPSPRSRDYSLGLFQINLLAHCAGALKDDWKTRHTCTILNHNALQSCEQRFYNPVENIQKAVQLSGGGVGWTPWSASLPQYCNIQ